MRKFIFAIAAMLLLGLALTVGGRAALSGATPERRLEVVIDSIVCRSDLSRVYCRALGHPNTSHRIDAVNLNLPGQALGATDIDPIYFERAFQWEEDGIIPLEIDFGPMESAPSHFTLDFFTPYGTIKAAYNTK